MPEHKAIIADDEPQLRAYLKSMLTEAWPDLSICGEAGNGKEALMLIENHQPDVVFLDIQMPGLTGLDVAKQIPETCRIVFVTAFDQYAVEAFENEAIDYLLKPVTRERLESTIKRLKNRFSDVGHQQIDLQKILEKMAKAMDFSDNTPDLQWIRSQQGNDIRLIAVDEVLYFKAQDKYTLVITQKGESLIRKPIKELALKLDKNSFWQINRGVIINVNSIDKASRSVTGRFTVRLKDHPDVLTVSRAYVHLFKQM